VTHHIVISPKNQNLALLKVLVQLTHLELVDFQFNFQRTWFWFFFFYYTMGFPFSRMCNLYYTSTFLIYVAFLLNVIAFEKNGMHTGEANGNPLGVCFLVSERSEVICYYFASFHLSRSNVVAAKIFETITGLRAKNL
jgi:hypothetical protein